MPESQTVVSRQEVQVTRERDTVHTDEKGPIELCWYYPVDGTTIDQPALLIANGWGEDMRVLDRAAIELASSGRPAVTFNHILSAQARPAPEHYKSTTFEAIYDRVLQTDESAQIVTHSEGAISVVTMLERRKAAGLRVPDRVVHTAPVGYHGVERPAHLLRRVLLGEVPEVFLRYPRSLGTKALSICIEGARDRTLHLRAEMGIREAIEIAATDLVPATIDLHDDGKGIEFDFLPCRKDKIVPYRRLWKHTESLRALGSIGWRVVDIDHAAFIANDKVVKELDGLLRTSRANGVAMATR